MASYLDKTGVSYLWSKIKDNFWAKSDIDTTFIEVVTTLPTTNIKRCLYLVEDSTTSQNRYAEYIYRGDLPISTSHPYDSTKWEKLGDFQAEVDLADYFKNVGTSQNKLTFTTGNGTVKEITVPYATLADKANKVISALNIEFNGITKASYNGSVMQEINITPAAINAVSLEDLGKAISYETDPSFSYVKQSDESYKLSLYIAPAGGSSLDKCFDVPFAVSDKPGVVNVGKNITLEKNGTISISSSNIKSALGYTPASIDDIPTSLKNPNAISWNGYNSGSYDGSAAKSFNIPVLTTCTATHTGTATNVDCPGYNESSSSYQSLIIHYANSFTANAALTATINGKNSHTLTIAGVTPSSSNPITVVAGTYLLTFNTTTYNLLNVGDAALTTAEIDAAIA